MSPASFGSHIPLIDLPSRQKSRTLPGKQSNPATDLGLRQSGLNDQAVLSELFDKYRGRIKKLVQSRMNIRLQGRLDASDIVQDTFVEASRTIDNFLTDPQISFYIWLRRLAQEKLIQAHRRHLGAKKRDANREFSIYAGKLSATSEAIAVQLVGRNSTPSEVVAKKDRKRQLIEAIDRLDALDREILTLRHFEHLTSKEAALILGIKYETVKKRYIRALDKLQRMLIHKT